MSDLDVSAQATRDMGSADADSVARASEHAPDHVA